ncbi:MAG: hypothetical protein ACREUX_22435 [Burkholderiales bacterium]
MRVRIVGARSALAEARRHLEHLDEVVVVGTRIERLAERERKRRRPVERALGRIDQDEFAVRARGRRRVGCQRSIDENAGKQQRGQQGQDDELGTHCRCCCSGSGARFEQHAAQ